MFCCCLACLDYAAACLFLCCCLFGFCFAGVLVSMLRLYCCLFAFFAADLVHMLRLYNYQFWDSFFFCYRCSRLRHICLFVCWGFSILRLYCCLVAFFCCIQVSVLRCRQCALCCLPSLRSWCYIFLIKHHLLASSQSMMLLKSADLITAS